MFSQQCSNSWNLTVEKDIGQAHYKKKLKLKFILSLPQTNEREGYFIAQTIQCQLFAMGDATFWTT